MSPTDGRPEMENLPTTVHPHPVVLEHVPPFQKSLRSVAEGSSATATTASESADDDSVNAGVKNLTAHKLDVYVPALLGYHGQNAPRGDELSLDSALCIGSAGRREASWQRRPTAPGGGEEAPPKINRRAVLAQTKRLRDGQRERAQQSLLQSEAGASSEDSRRSAPLARSVPVPAAAAATRVVSRSRSMEHYHPPKLAVAAAAGGGGRRVSVPGASPGPSKIALAHSRVGRRDSSCGGGRYLRSGGSLSTGGSISTLGSSESMIGPTEEGSGLVLHGICETHEVKDPAHDNENAAEEGSDSAGSGYNASVTKNASAREPSKVDAHVEALRKDNRRLRNKCLSLQKERDLYQEKAGALESEMREISGHTEILRRDLASARRLSDGAEAARWATALVQQELDDAREELRTTREELWDAIERLAAAEAERAPSDDAQSLDENLGVIRQMEEVIEAKDTALLAARKDAQEKAWLVKRLVERLSLAEEEAREAHMAGGAREETTKGLPQLEGEATMLRTRVEEQMATIVRLEAEVEICQEDVQEYRECWELEREKSRAREGEMARAREVAEKDLRRRLLDLERENQRLHESLEEGKKN